MGDLVNIKKIMLLFLFLIVSLNLGIISVFADCSECDVDSCEECGCVLNSNKTMCVYSNYSSATVSCGNGMLEKIPKLIPTVVSIAYTIIQIAVPVILVIMGSLDLFKGITANKEDEIKKGQQIFVKRLIAAALIFLVFIIVKIIVSVVADGNSADIMECAECFINNNCD